MCEEILTSFIVNCSHANLTKVPENIPSDTRELYLDYNHIRNVSKTNFRRLKLVEYIEYLRKQYQQTSRASFYGFEEFNKVDPER